MWSGMRMPRGGYSAGGATGSSYRDTGKVEAFFKVYSGGEDTIPVEGTEKLCGDCGFSTLDPVALVLCYHCGAKQMGSFTKQEFLHGMAVLGAQSVEELRERVADMRSQLHPKHPLSKKIYSNVFLLSLDPGQKQLGKEMAIEIWKLMLPLYGNGELAENWLDYYEAKICYHYRTFLVLKKLDNDNRFSFHNYVENTSTKPAISKDVWNMVFDLITTCAKDMSDYDDDGAWPVMIDDFAAHVRSQQRAGENQQGD
ncbi:unnamed protein product [Amoebophrya sp. A25]|nr:unnamed protein product [Amoebophrya sp. A25]|eukprot:GSA25T00024190001.1